MPNENKKCYCEKCGKFLSADRFYTYKDGSKVKMCKDCLTMHIDNFNPDTYLWVLEKIDVPYIPSEWITIRDKRFAKDPKKMTGMSVLGRYLAKMRLSQFKKLSWKDTERLAKEQKAAVEKAIGADADEDRQQVIKDLKERFRKGEITEAQYKTFMPTDEQNEMLQEYMQTKEAELNGPKNMAEALAQLPRQSSAATTSQPNSAASPATAFSSGDQFLNPLLLPNPDDELSMDEKIYLAIKWGRMYTAAEWVEMEENYYDMKKSFEVKDADTENALIHFCKTNLKMNQAIDHGDLDAYQKLSRVLDSLRKSANFTAAQQKKKSEEDRGIASIGELVSFCEEHGGKIPKYEITAPRDVIDVVIQDMKAYNRELIMQDTALARQIEEYLKKREILDESRRQRTLKQEHYEKTGEVLQDFVSVDDIVKYKEQEELMKQADIITQQIEEERVKKKEQKNKETQTILEVLKKRNQEKKEKEKRKFEKVDREKLRNDIEKKEKKFFN